MNGVSVIICCYNSSLRLPQTLQHLAHQQTNFPLQIIVVNNASTDNTETVAIDEWKKYNRKDVQFHIVSESRPGLNFAREKGILSSDYEVVVLCDDDNYLMDNFIQAAYEIFKNKRIGLAGGKISPDYESPPEQWFHRHAHYLAIGEQAPAEGDITDTHGILFGAGLVMRKSAYLKLKNLGFQPILTDRKKGSLMSGGDTELCMALRLLGYRLFYSETLQLKHYMPSARLSWTYLKQLLYGMGRSSIYFVAYYEYIMPDAALVPKGKKKLWWWQFLSSLKEFFKKTPAALLASLKNEKGSKDVLEWQFLRGRLSEILQLKGQVNFYYTIVDEFAKRICTIKDVERRELIS